MLILVLTLMVIIGLVMDFVLIDALNKVTKDVDYQQTLISNVVRTIDDMTERNRLT